MTGHGGQHQYLHIHAFPIQAWRQTQKFVNKYSYNYVHKTLKLYHIHLRVSSNKTAINTSKFTCTKSYR